MPHIKNVFFFSFSALRLFHRNNSGHSGDFDGCSTHIWICRSGQNHWYLQRKIVMLLFCFFQLYLYNYNDLELQKLLKRMRMLWHYTCLKIQCPEWLSNILHLISWHQFARKLFDNLKPFFIEKLFLKESGALLQVLTGVRVNSL